LTTAIELSLIPFSDAGGVNVDYALTLKGITTDITNDCKSVRLIFPSEFDIAAGSLSCEATTGFTRTAVPCSITAKNQMRISLEDAGAYILSLPFQFIYLTVKTLKNPLVEKGPFGMVIHTVGFSLIQLNSADGILSTTSQSLALNFNPPLFPVNELKYQEDKVYTQTGFVVKFTPAYEIILGSKLVISFPELAAGTQFVEGGAGFGCAGFKGIALSISY
jgi:hypothetical protein